MAKETMKPDENLRSPQPQDELDEEGRRPRRRDDDPSSAPIKGEQKSKRKKGDFKSDRRTRAIRRPQQESDEFTEEKTHPGAVSVPGSASASPQDAGTRSVVSHGDTESGVTLPTTTTATIASSSAEPVVSEAQASGVICATAVDESALRTEILNEIPLAHATKGGVKDDEDTGDQSV